MIRIKQSDCTHEIVKTHVRCRLISHASENAAYSEVLIPFNESEMANKRPRTTPWHCQIVKNSNLRPLREDK